VRGRLRRAKTQLQQKLDTLATQIGYVGLAAAGLSFAGMAVPFTWSTFVVQRQPWAWAFATDYLHMVIQAITILVSKHVRGAAWRFCYTQSELGST